MLTSPRLLASSTFALLLTGAAACLAQTPPAPPAGIAIPPAPAAALPTVNGVAITERDVSAALADLACSLDWTRPEMTEDTAFSIEGGRHPLSGGGQAGPDRLEVLRRDVARGQRLLQILVGQGAAALALGISGAGDPRRRRRPGRDRSLRPSTPSAL